MNLSKSKFCRGYQCNKMLWLDTHYPELAENINNDSVLDNGTKVGELAKDLFGFHFDVSFNEKLSEMIKDTKALLLNKNVVITEASFNYDNNFCSVDILKKEDNNYEIYEVKSSTEVHDIYKIDASYQYYVLKKLGYNVTKVAIVYLNKFYVRGNELDLRKLFKIEDITKEAIDNYSFIEEKIASINNYQQNDYEQEEIIDMKCFKPYVCPYFKYCSGNLKNSVFDLEGLRTSKKISLYHQGYESFKDLENVVLPDSCKMQIKYELHELGDYIDYKKIKEFVNEITYPLYFLDFETYQQSIPEYVGISPYDQIPFQYSLHYQDKKDGELFHSEFLANSSVDPRYELAKSLVKDIPMDVTVLAYNMAFEKTVIKKLANTYPDLSSHLMNIYDNIKDLIVPFRGKYYYNREMRGKSSIKYVLPAIFPNDPSLDYKNLDNIHNGSEAMSSFASLNNLTKEEQEIIRKSLLKYCELDTYAMVMIWNKLNEVVDSKKRLLNKE